MGNLNVIKEGILVSMSHNGDGTYSERGLSAVCSGEAMSGSTTTLVDTSKNLGTDVLKDKLLSLEIGNIRYIRKIISNTVDTITVAALLAAVAASTHVIIAEIFDITVTCSTVGVSGNAYTLEIVEAPGTNDNLSASFSAGVLTVYLGKTADVVDDLKNTATLVTAAIDGITEFTASLTGSGVVVVTEYALVFSGGVDAVPVVAGTAYEVI